MQWGMGSPHNKQVEPRRDSSPKSSAFLGVSWHRSTRRWHAYITVDSQQHSLGSMLMRRKLQESTMQEPGW